MATWLYLLLLAFLTATLALSLHGLYFRWFMTRRGYFVGSVIYWLYTAAWLNTAGVAVLLLFEQRRDLLPGPRHWIGVVINLFILLGPIGSAVVFGVLAYYFFYCAQTFNPMRRGVRR